MSLTKLLKAPIKLFKKDVITFLIIHRHDLGVLDEKLRYIAVKPTASISMLRQKIWYLLDLPDYCEEVIVLKSVGVEISLTELRKGNDPQHPYILEVWLPGKHLKSTTTTIHNNMLMGIDERLTDFTTTDSVWDEKLQRNDNLSSFSTVSNETMALKKHRVVENPLNKKKSLVDEYKKSDLTCRISSSTLLFKLHGKKSRDNFTSILLKIQSDLSTLSTKLSNLENRISS